MYPRPIPKWVCFPHVQSPYIRSKSLFSDKSMERKHTVDLDSSDTSTNIPLYLIPLGIIIRIYIYIILCGFAIDLQYMLSIYRMKCDPLAPNIKHTKKPGFSREIINIWTHKWGVFRNGIMCLAEI